MFPTHTWLAYTAACLLLAIAPGPDNLLAIGRGLSQGRVAACISGLSSGMGILFHSVAAALGLSVLMQTSAVAFWIIKIVGAVYLVWLGIQVLRSRSLVSFVPAKRQSRRSIFLTGFLSAALNPKPGLFVLAFIPQFIHPEYGSVTTQMLVYGAWFACITALVFALMGMFASSLSNWLQSRPRVIAGLNWGAGLSFIVSGLSVAAMKQK